ncbi:cyclin-domain-containing protein [Basidiobolus meristosporus CBS 931.73]|uniref:Cyclin-domain-containing protein n=1 Tax=Basidiobolus meristosporus CBS 931.73 TaxID=1314790 RepID=A0A1Y1XGM2_9FUNG|nr:cyclin-domain-containing protein [Basidiobolus meristosporus CBS 931.73]|eukprot:ORX84918.1 cyclin-domain-containing protein [Basidiobolus meristosporus CBS 931.73]
MRKTFNLAEFPTKDTVDILGNFLVYLVDANDPVPHSADPAGPPKPPSYTPFHAKRLPNITIHLYLSRILKYCPCNNECFIAILIYFDRMTKFYNQVHPHKRPFTIDAYNVHRLVIVGIMIASKFFSDVYYTNVRYAKVGGLPVKELNNLELEFLYLVQYQVNVGVPELQAYADQLLNYSSCNKMAFTLDRDEKLPKLLIGSQPVSTTSVSDVHALRTDTVHGSRGNILERNLSPECAEECKRSVKSLASFRTCDSLTRSPLGKPSEDLQAKQRRNEWPHKSLNHWCHNRFPSPRTSEGEMIGHASSVY